MVESKAVQKRVIQSFGCDRNYYKEASVELNRRLGRPTGIVGTIIQQLIHHFPPVANRPDKYIKYSSFIIRVLEAFNFSADLYSTTKLKQARQIVLFRRREEATVFG